MVFFTCSHCGESVKKPSVAKHYQTKCRNYTPFLTCVDCLKDFKENEYEAHTKCVTEDERYSAKGYVPKPSANKGERKQKAWSDCFQGLLSTGDLRPDEKNLLQAVSKYTNIPRRKIKFMNFLNTSLKAFANKVELIDRVWEKVENYFKEMNAEKQNPITKAENNSDECKGSQKRKQEECDQKNNETDEVEERKKKKRKNTEDDSDNMRNEQKETIEVGSENREDKKKKKKKSSKGEMESLEEVAGDVASELEIVNREGKKKKRKKQSEAEETNCKENELADESEWGTEEKESKKKKKNCNSDADITEREEPPKKKSKADLAKGVNGLDNKENVSEKKKSEKAASENVPAKGTEGKSEERILFNWTDAIVDILTANGKDNEMTLKKLQKKVLKKYRKVSNCEINEKAIRKFTKKLNKINGVVINGDQVCLNK